MPEQLEQIQRVRDQIGPLVIQFVRDRLAIKPHFVIQELVDFVAGQIDVAPASPQRILQLLRREGHFDYEVMNRRKSQYKVTVVYDPPQPEKTRPMPKINSVQARLILDTLCLWSRLDSTTIDILETAVKRSLLPLAAAKQLADVYGVQLADVYEVQPTDVYEVQPTDVTADVLENDGDDDAHSKVLEEWENAQ